MSNRTKVIGIIPARYESSRFPGKILAPIAGKSMIERVYEQSNKSKLLDELIVAVDDQRIYDAVVKFGGKAVMTSKNHQSGTDRLAEVMSQYDGDIAVNIQGDQPILDPKMIDECVQPLLDHPDIPMSTLKTEITPEEYDDPDVVKVVTDSQGIALYFSRSLIPYNRDKKDVIIYEHVGLYAFRKDFLLKFPSLPPSKLEEIEMLEQLRVLENGYQIIVAETHCNRDAGLSVDTPEDLEKIERIILQGIQE